MPPARPQRCREAHELTTLGEPMSQRRRVVHATCSALNTAGGAEDTTPGWPLPRRRREVHYVRGPLATTDGARTYDARVPTPGEDSILRPRSSSRSGSTPRSASSRLITLRRDFISVDPTQFGHLGQ